MKAIDFLHKVNEIYGAFIRLNVKYPHKVIPTHESIMMEWFIGVDEQKVKDRKLMTCKYHFLVEYTVENELVYLQSINDETESIDLDSIEDLDPYLLRIKEYQEKL